jgi:hypothetical protein
MRGGITGEETYIGHVKSTISHQQKKTPAGIRKK